MLMFEDTEYTRIAKFDAQKKVGRSVQMILTLGLSESVAAGRVV